MLQQLNFEIFWESFRIDLQAIIPGSGLPGIRREHIEVDSTGNRLQFHWSSSDPSPLRSGDPLFFLVFDFPTQEAGISFSRDRNRNYGRNPAGDSRLEMLRAVPAPAGDPHIRIYPQPAGDYFVLETDGQTPSEVALFDLYGRRQVISFGGQRLYFHHLSTGTYVLKINTGQGCHTRLISIVRD